MATFRTGRSRPARAAGWLGSRFVAFEERPFAVVLLAAVATVGVGLSLAFYAGWENVLRRVYAPHPWGWLAVCLVGELAAYLGYVLTIRDVSRVGEGPDMDLSLSTKTVVAGFGVFAATRAGGGFAIDYYAFRRAGAGRRDAASRVVALGFLEYAMLGLAALVASAALYLSLDGHASDAQTLPSLLTLPCVAAALWVTSPKRVARLGRSGRAAGRLKSSFANAVAGAENVRKLLTSPREHGVGLAGSSLYWAGDILCLWAALQFVGGHHVTLAALVLAYSSGYVLTRRALPAGGAGVVEIALTFALYWMGVHFTAALLGVIVYRLFNFWLPIVPALLLRPAIRELQRRFA